MEQEERERKARLLELQQRGEDDSLPALLLQMELEHGRSLTLTDVMAMMGVDESLEPPQQFSDMKQT